MHGDLLATRASHSNHDFQREQWVIVIVQVAVMDKLEQWAAAVQQRVCDL